MRHRHGLRKLNRTSSHRLAMLRNMTNSLFTHEAIKTTLPKAKELRRVAEPLITLAKTPTVANRRLAFDRLRDRDVVTKLFNDLGPRFKARPGGYLRILKFGFRVGRQRADGAGRAGRSSAAGGRRRSEGRLTFRPGCGPVFASLDAGLFCPAFFWEARGQCGRRGPLSAGFGCRQACRAGAWYGARQAVNTRRPVARRTRGADGDTGARAQRPTPCRAAVPVNEHFASLAADRCPRDIVPM